MIAKINVDVRAVWDCHHSSIFLAGWAGLHQRLLRVSSISSDLGHPSGLDFNPCNDVESAWLLVDSPGWHGGISWWLYPFELQLNSPGTGSFALPWSTASVSSPPPSHWLPRWRRSCRRSKRWVGWVGVSSFFLPFLHIFAASLVKNKPAKPAKHHLSQHVLVTFGDHPQNQHDS